MSHDCGERFLHYIFISFFDSVIPREAVFQAERGISRGASRRCAPDPSARW